MVVGLKVQRIERFLSMGGLAVLGGQRERVGVWSLYLQEE